MHRYFYLPRECRGRKHGDTDSVVDHSRLGGEERVGDALGMEVVQPLREGGRGGEGRRDRVSEGKGEGRY